MDRRAGGCAAKHPVASGPRLAAGPTFPSRRVSPESTPLRHRWKIFRKFLGSRVKNRGPFRTYLIERFVRLCRNCRFRSPGGWVHDVLHRTFRLGPADVSRAGAHGASRSLACRGLRREGASRSLGFRGRSRRFAGPCDDGMTIALRGQSESLRLNISWGLTKKRGAS
jgi:hypothetical protein